MSLPFSALCELWEQLSSTRKTNNSDALVREWFERQAPNIIQQGRSALALLSCLFPHRRPDRVYGWRERRLTDITVRAWGLGSSRRHELQRLQDEEGLDFASAVQSVVEDGGDPPQSQLSPTVEEVDGALDLVASACDFSSPELRNGIPSIFRQMRGLEVKWMIRMLLKDLGPAHVPETTAMQLFHPLLSRALRVRRSLSGALELLAPAEATVMQPQVGTMISLPVFEKARSITHCCHLLGGEEVSVERKYDGEYCQVHVQRSSSCESRVTIFSKSGRNSTVDRKLLLPTIRTCLDLDTPDCRMQRQCVLVGELLVWNDQQGEIMPFYKIRRYVTREGRQLGCDQDSPPSPDEHLMMMFYDILLLDDLNCIYEPYEQRRQRLNTLVRPVPGRVEIGEWEKMDFRRPDTAVNLAHCMANAITQHWEGLVLKARQDAYMSTHEGIQQHVKLKKDYIPGLGDSADLVVVGGRRDASVVHALGSGSWSWTAFYLACVENKDAVQKQNAKPIFRVVGEVSRPSISIADVRFLNRHGMLCETPFTRSHLQMDVHSELTSGQLPSTLFTKPAVVEVVGAGFDRLSDSRYYTLRFPRVVKIHHDRSFLDAVDFTTYQLMAEQSRAGNGLDAEGSHAFWLAKLGFDNVVEESDALSSLRASENERQTDSYASDGSASEKDLKQHENGQRARHDTKRKASCSSSRGSERKRLRCQSQAATTSLRDYALTTYDNSQLVEIEETPQDAQHSRSDCVNKDDSMSDVLPFSTPVLVHQSSRDSTYISGGAFLDTISTFPLELTFNPVLFWDRILQRAKDHFSHRQATEQSYLIITDWHHGRAVASALEFMSLATERRPELLEECAPYTILFAEWNVTKLLATESGPVTDLFRRHVIAFLRTHCGTVTLGMGTG